MEPPKPLKLADTEAALERVKAANPGIFETPFPGEEYEIAQEEDGRIVLVVHGRYTTPVYAITPGLKLEYLHHLE